MPPSASHHARGFKSNKQPQPDSRMAIKALLNPQIGSKQGHRTSAPPGDTQPRYKQIRSSISGSDCSSYATPRGDEHLSNADPYYLESEIKRHMPPSDMGQVNIFMTGLSSSMVPSTGPVVRQYFQRSVSILGKPNGGHDMARRRPPRRRYTEEEMYFVWYLRVDLGREWNDVYKGFNQRFPRRQRGGVQGIQCGFYRFIQRKRCPSLREQRAILEKDLFLHGATDGGRFALTRFGVVNWANVRYPWMQEGC